MGKLLLGFVLLSALLVGYVVVIAAIAMRRSREHRDRERAINADAWAAFCLAANHRECARAARYVRGEDA